jgi:hypothetical protein
VLKGKGGYALRINKTVILDCYDYCKLNECWASYANSATNLLSPIPPHASPKANAKLIIRGNNAFLVALNKVILPDMEILTHYGSSYVYE